MNPAVASNSAFFTIKLKNVNMKVAAKKNSVLTFFLFVRIGLLPPFRGNDLGWYDLERIY